MIRLLHVMAEMDPKKGGVGEAVRTMMRGLEESGVQNEAVSLDSADAAFLTNISPKIYALGPCRGPWCFSSKLLPWLKDNLHNYDAIIVHGLWLYPGYGIRKAFNLLKQQEKCKAGEKGSVPKLFVMPHGMLDPYFQRSAGRRLKAIRNWFYWKLVEGRLVNQSDGLFFTSQEEKTLAAKPFRPYHPKQETVIGLGIEEPPEYTPTMKKAFSDKCPEMEDRPYILYLGRIDEKKGVDLLIQAYEKCMEVTGYLEGTGKLNSTVPAQKEHNYLPKLVIAGPGIETAYGKKIQQLAMPLKQHIFFPGMLMSDAKWGAFYGCEAFSLPSHQENFGIAVVEAMACGKPVLISDQVNIWKEIKAAGAGLVENDTEDGTYKLLHKWNIMSEDDRKSMKKNALSCFKDIFSIRPAAVRIKNAMAGS